MKNLKPQDKIKIAIEIVEVAYVFDNLIKFLTFKQCDDWDLYMIEDDGSIYQEELGRYLTDEELEEFLSYAKQLVK